MKKLVTHNGSFHADDVMAYGILKTFFAQKGESFEIVRTRDREIIKTGDIVFDVGDEYDASRNRYDHHQKGRAGERKNGVPYASCGLIWKHFGRELCSSEEMWERIDQRLLQGMDAIDSGFNLGAVSDFAPLYSICDVLCSFIPKQEDRSDEYMLECFKKSGDLAEEILNRELLQAEEFVEGTRRLLACYEKAEDKKIIVLDQNYDRIMFDVFMDKPEPLFLIYPSKAEGLWRTETVREKRGSFKSRKSLPAEWGGLRTEDLIKVSGIPDLTFCHPGLFVCQTTNFDSAVEVAKRALLM